MASQLNVALPPDFKLNGGNYIIDRKISVGGFSIVYLAHNKNGTPVAIKEYMPSEIKSRESVLTPAIKIKEESDRVLFEKGMESFLREVEAISKIDDEYIIKILNFFTENNTAYIVMKYENGQTLQNIIQNKYHLLEAEESILKYFIDITKGVAVLHRHNMLHLDIKPSNIMIRNDGRAMLLDFGTSRLELVGKSMSPLMHTPGYAALEQHKNFYNPRNIGPWTDLYSLGATIYSCLERKIPPSASRRQTSGEPLGLKNRWYGEYNVGLLNIIEKLMSLEYKERYLTAPDLLQDLLRCKKNKVVDLPEVFFKSFL